MSRHVSWVCLVAVAAPALAVTGIGGVPTTASALSVTREQPESTRCPLAEWRGRCRRMSEGERQRVRRVVEMYTTVPAAECASARTAVTDWLAGVGETWLFEQHANDRPLVGTLVFGVTLRVAATEEPTGLGFRRTFLLADELVIARVALHEGAHLTGADEASARQLEATCVPAPA